MIVNKITICNIRNYVGPIEVDLSVCDSRNIILMGGLNGAGKTTFADSIRLCLYGHRINGKVLSEPKYQEFLADFCTNTENISQAYVAMSITIDEENPPMDIDIKRTFTKTKSGFKEDLSLKKGGSAVELIDENYWSYYIEKLIPPNVSRYFFFDGEKVKDTIATENSTGYLSNAVRDLSGVSELETLEKDLVEVRRNILSRTKKKADLEKISSINRMIEYHRGQVDKIDKSIDEECNAIFDLDQARVAINADLSRISGANESKKKKYKDSLKQMSSECSELDEFVSDFCYSRLMYAVASDALSRTISQAKSENQNQISKFTIDALKNIQEQGSFEKMSGLGKERSDELLNGLIQLIGFKKDDDSAPILDVSLSCLSQMESTFVSEQEIGDFQSAYSSREELHHNMAVIQKKIDKIEDESLSEYDDELDRIDRDLQIHDATLAALDAEKKSNVSKIEELIKDRTKAEHSIVLEDVDKEVVRTIDELMGSISSRISRILSDARVALVKKINEIYSVLKNNEDMIKEISLSENYDLEAYNFDNKPVKIKGLSEGEKSILMYSVVYGLHSLSSLQFPMIIDSPIGRMDSIHSDNLANRLYPIMSNQLILLSHNREIVGSLHDALRPQIAKEYMIVKYGNPKVFPGYFD
ncbi:DNA sulfur modification protein DndD [Methanomethylophilus alvi]|uniref:DNA sulfur modification protein DndD n=1 Tax=Methanomethylophilus alvi TaxID=1291540 RepID=UPI0037DC4347